MKKLLSLLSILIFLYSCGKEPCNDPTNPNCPNYNPCYGHTSVSADFDILESGTYLPIIAPGFNTHQDTILWNYAFFCPKDSLNTNQFTWYIGAETLNVKRFYRANFPENTWVNVSLVVTRNSDTCLSVADRKDSVTKSFYVLDAYDFTFNPTGDKPAWIGKYRGAYSNTPLDSFDFELNYYEDVADSTENLIFTGCTGVPFDNMIYANYNAFHMPIGMEFYSLISPNATSWDGCMNIRPKKINGYLPDGSNVLQVQWQDLITNQWNYMNAYKTQ